ncbi:hypothetical protein BASA60_007518 [Batrachochytrium salamandrivorans]|nr:hypothetical protein BASA60_007518 [Batrachochytrium salamandrivorans]
MIALSRSSTKLTVRNDVMDLLLTLFLLACSLNEVPGRNDAVQNMFTFSQDFKTRLQGTPSALELAALIRCVPSWLAQPWKKRVGYFFFRILHADRFVVVLSVTVPTDLCEQESQSFFPYPGLSIWHSWLCSPVKTEFRKTVEESEISM